MDLSLISGNSEELIYKISHFQLDGAFVKSFPINDDNIIRELVFEENLVLISSPEYSDIKSLCLKPFLMNSVGCPNRIQLENWLRLNGISSIRFMEFNNLDSIIEGVIADLGASFVPKSAVEKYEEKGLLKSFTIPEEFSNIRTFFIRHKDSLKTNALAKFIELIESTTPYHSVK